MRPIHIAGLLLAKRQRCLAFVVRSARGFKIRALRTGQKWPWPLLLLLVLTTSGCFAVLIVLMDPREKSSETFACVPSIYCHPKGTPQGFG